MAERKYQFERLTPIDNMDLDVYEEAIDYVFDERQSDCDYKIFQPLYLLYAHQPYF